MLIAKVASVLTTNRLPLPPASTIHHADCFGVVVSKLCGIDLVFFELTKLFQNRDGLSAGSNGVFIVSLGKYFLWRGNERRRQELKFGIEQRHHAMGQEWVTDVSLVGIPLT